MFSRVLVAEAKGDLSPVAFGNANPVFTTVLSVEDRRSVSAFVKPCDSYSLVAELIASVLARGIGIPAPEPFIVVSSHEEFKTTSNLGFGSANNDHLSINRLIGYPQSINMAALRPLLERLSKWKFLANAVVFDELVFNPDRNLGNLLYCGKNDFMVIDHEKCFSCANPREKSINKLVDIVLQLGEFYRKKLEANVATKAVPELPRIDYKQLLTCTRISELIDNAFDLESFFEERLILLPDHLKQSLEHSAAQQDLLQKELNDE